MAQQLYLMRNSIGLHKVGISNHPEQRRRTLSKTSGLPIILIRTWYAPNALVLEGMVHTHFKDRRKEGEWFEFTEADLVEVHTYVSSIGGTDEAPEHREVVRVVSSVELPTDEPPYVKLYIDATPQLIDLEGSHTTLLLELVHKMDSDNFVYLPTSARAKIAAKLGIKDQTFRNNLSKLVRQNVIRRVGHSEFEVNPEVFSRGDWAATYERQRAFRPAVCGVSVDP